MNSKDLNNEWVCVVFILYIVIISETLVGWGRVHESFPVSVDIVFPRAELTPVLHMHTRFTFNMENTTFHFNFELFCQLESRHRPHKLV